MKKIIFISLLILSVGCMSVLAQRGANRGSRNGNQGNRKANQTRGANQGQRGNQARRQNRPPKLLRGLNLSGAQKQQLKDIRAAAKENGTDRKEVASQIRGVLDEKQLAKLDKRIERRAAKRARKKEKRERRRARRQENQTSDTPPASDNP